MSQRRYRFLAFKPGVDYQDVNQALLIRLNRLGMSLHKVITVSSGYRTRAEQEVLYQRYVRSGYDIRYIAAKPGHSEHEFGRAVDAELEGVALSRAVSSKTLKRFGLTAPVKGDYPHIQLLGAPTAAEASTPAPSASTPATPDASTTDASVAASVPTIPDQGMPPGGPPAPEGTVPGLYAPGSLTAGDYSPRRIADTWQLITSKPLSSPESQQFAQRAAAASGG